MIDDSTGKGAPEAGPPPPPPPGNGRGEQRAARWQWRRLWPLAALLAAFALVFATGLDDYLGLDTLARHQAELTAFVAQHALAAALGYMAVYAVVTALSLPGATAMSVCGGFLFGRFAGTGLIVIGATVGATLVFLAARSAFGGLLRARAGPTLQRMEDGFRRDAFNYLLFLRLVPAFPFFLVNLAPAFLGVRLRTYVLATAIGIIPGAFVYAQVGTGLGSVLAIGKELNVWSVLTPDVLLAMFGLAVLALLPVAYRRLVRRDDR